MSGARPTRGSTPNTRTHSPTPLWSSVLSRLSLALNLSPLRALSRASLSLQSNNKASRPQLLQCMDSSVVEDIYSSPVAPKSSLPLLLVPCRRYMAHSLPCERSARPLLCCIPHMRLQDNISSHLVVPLLLRLSLSLSRRCRRAAIAQLRACCSPLSTPSHNLISLSPDSAGTWPVLPTLPQRCPPTRTHKHTQAQHTHSTGTDGTRSRRASAETLRRLPCPLRSFAPTPPPEPCLPTMVRIAKSPLPHPSSPLCLLLLSYSPAGGSLSSCLQRLSLSLSRKPAPAAVLPPSLFRRRTSC